MADTTVTRHERFREILATAAGDSASTYGGAAPFWELPIEELKEARLDGIRLIEPEGAGCGCGCATGGRGEASALVRGLRGEPPFDGSRFPRLPWGGAAVSEEDIEFIVQWIDDGLPAGDRRIATLPVVGEVFEPVLEEIRPDNVEEDARRLAPTPGEYAYQRGEIKQRMNIDCMTDTQVDELRYAMHELYRLNKWPEDRRSYNNLALVHLNHCQHGWERFLPWHRIYLYEFEQALQDVSPGVTLPYWDWTMAQYMPRRPQDGAIIPKAFRAFLTEGSIAFLETARPPLHEGDAEKLRGLLGETFTSPSKLFARVKELTGRDYSKEEGHRRRFVDALLAANPLWYPLRYPAEFTGKTINEKVHYHYPKPEDIEEILSLRSFRDFGGGSLYNDSFGFLDQNPHNTLHIWTGGWNPDYVDPPDLEKDLSGNRNRAGRVAGRRFHTRDDMYSIPPTGDMLSNLTASYDPIFWPIHSNVDRLWDEWQQLNPHSNPQDLDAVLTPWGYTVRDTLDAARFGYEYVKSTQVLPVGLEAPVGRFVSRPLDVPEPVRQSFESAEVRLHRVPQLPRSCFVRVFLNLDDANASTPIDDPRYAGYVAIFGHGECYGGPGHCDIPPRQARPYDLRPRSHDTPRNHRVKVTAAARRLIDEGATSLRVTLVVIGADYLEDDELLRMEGLSLSFFD